MALLWTICVCGLFSLVLSASPECEKLIKPLDMTDPTVINGKWILAASVGQPSAKWQAYMDNLSSSWGEMSASSEDSKVRVTWADRMAGQCFVGTVENQLSGNKVSMMYPCVFPLSFESSCEGVEDLRIHSAPNPKCSKTNSKPSGEGKKVDGTLHEGEYLQTCPDCLLLTDVSTEDGVLSKFLYLNRRVGSTVTEGELETVKKQAQCLGIAPTIHTFATDVDYCPLGTEDKEL